MTDIEIYSGEDKAKQEARLNANQIQSAMQALPLHPGPQRRRQSGEAKAEFTSRYDA